MNDYSPMHILTAGVFFGLLALNLNMIILTTIVRDPPDWNFDKEMTLAIKVMFFVCTLAFISLVTVGAKRLLFP